MQWLLLARQLSGLFSSLSYSRCTSTPTPLRLVDGGMQRVLHNNPSHPHYSTGSKSRENVAHHTVEKTPRERLR